MSIWNQNKDDNNGVEVYYTGKSIYHKTDDKGHYDAKITANRDNSCDVYTTSSNWRDHTHTHYDKDGECTYHRDEGYNHPWETRIDD